MPTTARTYYRLIYQASNGRMIEDNFPDLETLGAFVVSSELSSYEIRLRIEIDIPYKEL